MSLVGFPPGSILQYLYLQERLKSSWNSESKKFLEIGSGNGHVSSIFLKLGWSGIGIDLNKSACKNNEIRNLKYIIKNKYKVLNDDFLNCNISEKFDVIISYMVIEHLSDNHLDYFMIKAISLLEQSGTIIIQVPSNMKFWGIEDEIAGHIKRYEKNDVYELAKKHKLRVNHIAALNYPLSNWLFKLSNYIIKKNEKDKLFWSQKDRTIYTGNRNVFMKTRFPRIFNIILNPIVLYPFYILQKIFKNKYDNSLVLYFELKNL